MLRFLSRRKNRHNAVPTAGASDAAAAGGASQIKAKRIETNKNMIQCRIVLLDGTDLSVDLTVSYIKALVVHGIWFVNYCHPALDDSHIMTQFHFVIVH